VIPASPFFPSKFLKRIFTRHQLLILLLFKEYLSEDYCDKVELTEIMNTLREKIQLEEVPNFTTLHKFCQRIRSSLFVRLLTPLMKMFYDRGERVSGTTLDLTGFISSYASHYYSLRFGKTRKRFLKTSISIDTESQVITRLMTSQHPVHEVIHAKNSSDNVTEIERLTVIS